MADVNKTAVWVGVAVFGSLVLWILFILLADGPSAFRFGDDISAGRPARRPAPRDSYMTTFADDAHSSSEPFPHKQIQPKGKEKTR